MSSLAIIEDFDVVEQAGFGLFVCQIVFPMHLLFFERGKEALNWRIVPTVAFATHAAHDASIAPVVSVSLIQLSTFAGEFQIYKTHSKSVFWKSSKSAE